MSISGGVHRLQNFVRSVSPLQNLADHLVDGGLVGGVIDETEVDALPFRVQDVDLVVYPLVTGRGVHELGIVGPGLPGQGEGDFGEGFRVKLNFVVHVFSFTLLLYQGSCSRYRAVNRPHTPDLLIYIKAFLFKDFTRSKSSVQVFYGLFLCSKVLGKGYPVSRNWFTVYVKHTFRRVIRVKLF